MKNEWELNRDYFLDLSLTFKPARDEYQNFGIMQAIDILNAILYTKNHILKMGGGYKNYFNRCISWWVFSKFMCKNSSLECR
ncbi:TPA: DUF2920 family protein, partial [Campylobacter lari]|nr:DUF2920 family protein [Campylobacter lari]